MKKVIILSVLVLLACQLFSQSQYKYCGGKIIVGKNVKYICKSHGTHPYLVRIDNINNKDTTDNVYYDNGKLLTELEIEDISGVNEFPSEDIDNVAKVLFSEEELKLLKESRGFILINFVTNNIGEPIEINFEFMRNAPVLSTLSPDRFYELEIKLKQILKMKISKSSQNIRNPKWLTSIEFDKIP